MTLSFSGARCAVFLSILFLLCACAEEKRGLSIEEPNKLSYGKDSLVFTPSSNKPITVYYYIPIDFSTRKLPILFTMHGADRNAEYQIETWSEIAQDKGIIIIAPRFSKSDYPELRYQFGGVSATSSYYSERPREEWTYNIIEELFDYIKSQTGNKSKTYNLWGHSAGSQFVHRMALYMKDARIGKIVASNAGSYTFPLPDGIKNEHNQVFGFPYSAKGTNLSKEEITAYLGKDITIHLGTADLASSKQDDPYFADEPGAYAQGGTRYERGKNFYYASQELARQLECNFNWSLVEVEGVGHSSRKMVTNVSNGAALLLYN